MQSVSPCRAGGSPRFKMGGRRRHDVRVRAVLVWSLRLLNYSYYMQLVD